MSVVYNTNDVDINRVISIKVTKESLNNVMNQLFRGVNVSFSIVDNHIVLSAKSNKEEQQKKTPITASGTVTDSKGEPLIGVSILVKRNFKWYYQLIWMGNCFCTSKTSRTKHNKRIHAIILLKCGILFKNGVIQD